MISKLWGVVFRKEGEFVVAQCQNPDISSFGKTQKEANENIEEALRLYYEK